MGVKKQASMATAWTASILLHGLLLVGLAGWPATAPPEIKQAYEVQLVAIPVHLLPVQAGVVAALSSQPSVSQPSVSQPSASQPSASQPSVIVPLSEDAPPLPKVLRPATLPQVSLGKANTSVTAFKLENSKRERDKAAVLAWRLYLEDIGQRVRDNYDFPAKFSSQLRAVVRLRLAGDGSKQEITLTSSSGNQRFDQLVCLARIHNTSFPPLPKQLPKQLPAKSAVLVWTCTP